MATTNIDAGNIYITTGTVSSNVITHDTNKCVKIHTTKIDHNFDNQLVVLPIPISKGNRSTNTAYARAVDLKRINESIQVQGFLAEESSESAHMKRTNLISMMKTGNALTVVWGYAHATNDYQTLWTSGTAPYGGFIQKVQFTETAGLVGGIVGRASNEEPAERNITINITLIRGQDI
jgi:hypothetical protein